MANNIAISITADIADLQVKRAIMSAELRTATKNLNDFAKEAATSGTTDELRTSMLASGNDVARLRSQIALADTQIKAYRSSTVTVAEATNQETEAVEANTGAHGSNRAAREAIVIVHEALSGNYHRMIGSLMIEAQALAGAERSAAAFGAVLTPMGIAIVAVVAALGAGAIAALEYEESQRKLIATSIGVGAASGLTAAQLEAAGSTAADWSGRSVSASTEAAAAFAAAGVSSQATIAMLAGDVKVYAELTGQDAADAQKSLAQAMQDPIKGAQMLHEQLHILDGTQLEQIRTMVEAGDKTGALNVIIEALQHRVEEARTAGVGANGTFATLGATLSNLWRDFGQAAAGAEELYSKLQLLSQAGPKAVSDAWAAERAHLAAAAAAQRRAAADSKLADASSTGATLVHGTPEGKSEAARTQLSGALATIKKGLAADLALPGDHAASIQADRRAVEEYTRALNSYLSPAEKAHAIAEKDAQLAEAKHGHDKAKVAQLTREREVLSHAGEVMSSADVNQRADDAANIAEDRTNAPKGRKIDAVSKWQEELRAQQVASQDYFRDETSNELAFWQGKLALVTKGSHDWLEVQGHIYEANKALAHQDYDEHLAALNEKIAADRGSWSKEQADWSEKLAFIKSKYGEQAAEYKRALAEMDNATREHNKQELADTERHIRESTQALKSKLEAQAQIRESAAQSQETVVRDGAAGSPLGEIAAAARVGAINAQLNQAKLADLEAFHAAETAQLDTAIKSAQTLYNGDRSQYQALIDAKTKANQDYANKKAELDAKTRQQSIQDILAVKSAYHSYTDGLVSSAMSGLDGALSKQKSWAQAGIGIYQTLAHTFEQQIEKMLASWIVKHLLMSSAQRAQLAVQQGAQTAANASQTAIMIASSKTQVAALAGVAGAGGVASMAAAPFPLDLGAPAFGAEMAAAAVSLGSFAVGTNVVPSDMIAQIHAGERIIPAADNRELMSAVKGGGAGGRGDMHLTYAPQLNGDTPSFREQLHGHKDELVGIFRNMMRNGSLRPV